MKTILTCALFLLLIAFCAKHLIAVESDYTSQLLTNSEQQHFLHEFTNFSLTNTTASGKVRSVIQSPQTNYLVANQKTIMNSPEILMHREQEPPITMTSDTAEVIHQDNLTILQNNVIVSISKKNAQALRLTTEKLILNNTTQTAKTNLPASIFHGKGEMHGRGLEFNSHTKQIKFLNEVRGQYEN